MRFPESSPIAAQRSLSVFRSPTPVPYAVRGWRNETKTNMLTRRRFDERNACDRRMRMRWRRRGRTLYLRFVYQGIVAQNVPAFDVCHQCCGRSACRLGGGIVRGEHHKPRLPPTARNRISRRFLNVLNHDERDGYAPAQWENRLFHRLCAGFDRRARHGRCVRVTGWPEPP